MNTQSSQLLELILSAMNNKDSMEIVVEKYSFTDCEEVRYILWNEFKVEAHQEQKKIILSIWRR